LRKSRSGMLNPAAKLSRICCIASEVKNPSRFVPRRARNVGCCMSSGRNGITSFAILAFGGFYFDSHVLTHGATEKPTHAVRLPSSGFHDLGQSGAPGPAQQCQDALLLRTRASRGLGFALDSAGRLLPGPRFFIGGIRLFRLIRCLFASSRLLAFARFG